MQHQTMRKGLYQTFESMPSLQSRRRPSLWAARRVSGVAVRRALIKTFQEKKYEYIFEVVTELESI